MLKFILGRASTGKTTYVRNVIADAVNNGREAVLIVPEQFSFESEKAVIELLGAKKASEIEILSFSSLAKKIVDKFVPVRKPSVNDSVKSVIMSIALETLSEKLEIFGGCTKNKKTVSELLKMTDEMIQCDVSAAEMLSAAERSGNAVLEKKAHELTLASEMYEALLTSRFSDDRYIINAAAKILGENKLFQGKIVVFDEFTGFTPQENLIAAEILKQADEVYVTQCAESVSDNSGGTGVFTYAVKNIRKLIALCNKNNIKVAEPIILTRSGDLFNSPAIAAVEAGIYQPVPEIYCGDAPEITIAAAKNPYEECDFVAMTAKKLVREKNLRYRDIVVIGRDSSYRKYLTFAFKKYDIPVFEDMRRRLEDELIVRYASAALSLAADGFTSDMVFRFLKTDIFGMTAEDTAQLENYVLVWQIDRGGWLREWTGHPDGYGNEFDEDAKNKLRHINELRRSVTEPISALKDELADSDGFGCTKALYDFLIRTHADKNLLGIAKKLENKLAVECGRSWSEFMNMLSLLADTIDERNITPERYLELFKIMVASSDIGDIPTGLDEITIGDADRIRVSAKKILFIVGANEGVFPSGADQSFVLTENERRILKSQGVELNDDGMEKMQKERLRVYSTVSIPSDMLCVSYSLGDFKDGTLAPSEIVTMIKRIVPLSKKIEVSLLPNDYSVESRRSAFESAAIHFSDNTSYSRSVKECVSHDPVFKDSLKCIERLCSKESIAIKDKDTAVRLFGKNMYLTPSRVEKYYKCPFSYFCRYGLYAKPLQKAVFDSRQNGLVVHYVLEKMFALYGSDGIVKLSKDEMKKEVEKYVDEYIECRMGGKESLTQRAEYSMIRCQLIILEILTRLVNEFCSGKFKTRDVELNIGADGDIPSYILDIPDGGKVYLSGVVDRVDTMEADDKVYLRVVDYKTGGKDFNLRDVMSGLNIQMLVYLMCLFENGRDRYGNVIPAGVLYVPAKKGRNELDRHADENATEAKRTEQGKMNGIVLSDKDVILGMEESGGGLIINASITSDGKIKGSTFDMHQFELLHKAVDDTAVSMARDLHEGKVNVSPVIDGIYKSDCKYCDYKAVCCREDGDEYTSLFNGDVWEALEEMYNG